MVTGELYVDRRGAGEVDVVALHGAPQDPEAVAEAVSAALPEARVWTPHMPGYGGSADVTLGEGDPLGLGLLEAALAGRFASCVLVGISVGAYRALGLAARGRVPVAGVFAMGSFARIGEHLSARMRGGAEAVRSGVDVQPLLVETWFSARFREAHAERARAVVERHLGCLGREATAAEQEAVASGPDLRPRLDRFTGPVCLGVGALDEATPPELTEEVARALPQAEVRRFAGCGHLVEVEAPEAFGQALRYFVATTRS
ncbi:MAG TPA: alpha/beta fold hydrolase [Polyangiaceae bacterium LLY-WYZ-15_(1-7)]|nr:alpha/beta fold hydrolase [Polyangiaceae bacterium LLY-WYZ-15_(1-7)]